MSGPAGFLEFFILEASDYVEQLDGLLLGGGPNGPDAVAVQRTARALRGTATMAKIPSFAELASGVEGIGRAIQDGAVQWGPALGGALVAAIDDLKTLLHSARTWSPADDKRAIARAAELARFAPAHAAGTATAAARTSPSGGGSPFLATEAANIAAGLELLTAHADDPETAANVLRRVRALRGVAGVKEIGPLSDALEATEAAARGVESGNEPLNDEARRLLERAAIQLRALASALRTGGDVNAQTPEREAFVAAHETWSGHTGEPKLVVPIAHLFYSDGAPGVVETSQHPPTSAFQRFRMELVSLGEHLGQVVAASRQASDAASAARARRDLRRALDALQAAAESFGEQDVADFIGTHVQSTEHIDFLGLAALEDLASLLLEPGSEGQRLSERLREIVGGRDLTRAIGAGFGGEEPAQTRARERPLTRSVNPQTAAAPLAVAVERPPVAPLAAPFSPSVASATVPAPPPRQRQSAPPGIAAATEVLDQYSAGLIDASIAALDGLEANPFSDPVPLPEDVVVPIESLLYRGRAALDRAVEIRDELRGTIPVRGPTALEELFDLLELARAE